MDDPKKPEFASWQSYHHFAQKVRGRRRFIWEDDVKLFLATVLATNKSRDMRIAKGQFLCRAQRGVAYVDNIDDDGTVLGQDIVGHSSRRMKPRADRAREGRINPPGIPVLYLASTIETAISETRPWVGSEISVAKFQVVRDLRVINLSKGHGKSSLNYFTMEELLEEKAPTPARKAKAVWIDIDNAFSRPVTLSDDKADYVPTQILAELFKDEGYDGIIYRSQFGKKGYNIALFKPSDAEPISCAPYEVRKLKVTFKEVGNSWYRVTKEKVTD